MTLKNLNLPVSDRNAFLGFSIILLVSLVLSVVLDAPLVLGAPVFLLLLLFLFVNYRIFYYLLIIGIPFSIQYDVIPGGLTVDLPSEPLMALLSGCFLASLLIGIKPERRFYRHPIVVLILIMYLWSVASTLFSVDTAKSLKYLAAKAWYVIPFLFFSGMLIKNVADIRKILWCFLVPLFFLVVFVMVKHASLYFAFDAIQVAVYPIFKNHVIYAATVALFVPYLFTLWKLENGLVKTLLIAVFVIMLLGVAYSYTRASWISLPLSLLYYLALRFKVAHYAVIIAYIAGISAIGYFITNNNFMLYAPDYETTIFNEGDIEKHLEATYKMQDVSGMERVYRWVAAMNLAADKPLTGSGPSTFYPEYKKYTISSFKTYVSNNPEKSTTHNYFLLQLAEQGIIGAVLFMILIAYILILPQRLYYRTKNPEYRAIIVGAACCLLVIVFHLLLNELLEVDKIGSFYYISIAILVKLDIWTWEEKKAGLLKPAA